MTETDPLELAGWQLVAGDLASEDLPLLATQALVRGLDSPSLRALAGQDPRDVRDSRDLFVRALEELDMTIPDAPTAMRLPIGSKAAAIAAGELSPQEGAQWLRHAYFNVEDEGDLRVFYAISSDMDDFPEDSAKLEADVISAASDLLQRPDLRRWVRLMASVDGCPLTRLHGETQSTIGVDPSTLALSQRLLDELSSWNSSFSQTMAGWPRRGGFETEAQAEAFVNRGKQLTADLQAELGPEYRVEYRPEPIRLPGVKLSVGRPWWRRR